MIFIISSKVFSIIILLKIRVRHKKFNAEISLLKEAKMKTLSIFMLFLLMAGGSAHAKNYEMTKQSGAYSVTIKIDNNPPVAGDNNISIVVTDTSGGAVKDAKVSVEYSMPAMPGMPAMNYRTDTELKGDEYQALLHLSNRGTWTVNVKIARQGKTTAVKFIVDAK